MADTIIIPGLNMQVKKKTLVISLIAAALGYYLWFTAAGREQLARAGIARPLPSGTLPAPQ
jgi:hypothetical protein